MPFNPIPPFSRDSYPLTNVTPVTYSDGRTYALSLLELEKYIRGLVDDLNAVQEGNFDRIIDALNDALTIINNALNAQTEDVEASIAEFKADYTEAIETARQAMADQLAAQDAAVTAKLAAQTAAVEAILEALQNESIDFSDPVMVAIIGDTDTNTRKLLDQRYGKNTVHIVPGWGQSNMSGRGRMSPGDNRYLPLPERLKMFGFNQRIIETATPILDNMDVPPGIGPLYDFGLRLLSNSPDGDIVLLAPAAKGATPLVLMDAESWNPNYPGSLFHQAMTHLAATVAAAKLAYPNHIVKVSALLWHQGEGDNTFEQYLGVFRQLVTLFREAHGATTPILIGQMQPTNITGNRYLVNQAHTSAARYDDHHAFASMPRNPAFDIGDGTHYNAEGQRELARSYWLAYTRAKVNLQPRQLIQTGVSGEIGRDEFSYSGEVLKDLYGNVWEVLGSTPSNVGKYIADGSFAKLDPASPGGGRQFLVTDCMYSRRVTVLTQFGGVSTDTYRIILAMANANDYLFIGRESGGGKFTLGRYKDGDTTTLGTSALDSGVGELSVSVGTAGVSASYLGNAVGGDFPVTIPVDFIGGTKYGVSMQSVDASSTLLNRILFRLLDARPE